MTNTFPKTIFKKSVFITTTHIIEDMIEEGYDDRNNNLKTFYLKKAPYKFGCPLKCLFCP